MHPPSLAATETIAVLLRHMQFPYSHPVRPTAQVVWSASGASDVAMKKSRKDGASSKVFDGRGIDSRPIVGPNVCSADFHSRCAPGCNKRRALAHLRSQRDLV